jgi:YjbE family integral membrane protein
MELFSTEFLSALAAIIVIDLVLAGDNAIVIALAARGLPAHLRKQAIVWGTVGAIVVRTAMTVVVVWLLKIPGLLAIGGALLIWIAAKLVIEKDEGDEHSAGAGATTFWGAMKTIVIADALMGLDNVLAVAGAAHGNFLLVVLGLLISIPIVIWGSQLILKYVERFPVIVYIGAAVLAWTAVKMVVSEPLIKDYLADYPIVSWAAYVLVIGGVVVGGFLANHAHVRRRIAQNLAVLAQRAEPAVATGAAAVKPSLTLLLPVDASPNTLEAVEHAVNQYQANHALELHLLHVRTPFSEHVARFSSRGSRMSYHEEQAERALAPVRAILGRYDVPFTEHTQVGDKAERIAEMAEQLGAAQIVMGTARKNSLTRLLEDSTTHRVLELAKVPVQIVVGKGISKLERFGVPATVALAVLLALTAAD